MTAIRNHRNPSANCRAFCPTYIDFCPIFYFNNEKAPETAVFTVSDAFRSMRMTGLEPARRGH